MTEESQSLFDRPTVRAGIVATIVILVAYAGKLYVSNAPKPLAETQKTAGVALQAAFAELESAAKGAKDIESYKKTLPEMTSWYPAMPCGDLKRPYGQKPKDWGTLPTSWAKETTAYSYRFHKTKAQMFYIGRRDRDCDGIYEVHMLKVSSGWTGGMDKSISEVHNPGE